jgi:hypothetical protein
MSLATTRYGESYFREYGGYVGADDQPSYAENHVLAKAQDICAIVQPRSVLDCGCAVGALVHGFMLYDDKIVAKGCDFSEYAVEHARPAVRPHLSIVDITEGLPYTDNEFELVTAFDLLEHIHTYEKLVYSAEELCRVASRWILLRQPMVHFIGFTEATQVNDWITSLNILPHKARLELYGYEQSRARPPFPDEFHWEHPNMHPRGFWIELFQHYGYMNMELPEHIYHFPNANSFCSFNLLVFERQKG